MATPARKSVSSRKATSRSAASKARGASSRPSSRKTSAKTSSTARTVRSGRSGSTSFTKGRAISRRSASKPTARSKEKTIIRTQNKRANRTKTASKNHTFSSSLLRIIISFFALLSLLFIGWYFILPSVLLDTSESKNIVYVTDDIDSLNSKILFAHLDKNEAKNALYILDGGEQVEVPNGYGVYAVGAVPSLLKMDQQSDGTILSIMSRIFRLPIDEIVMAEPLSSTGSNTEMLEQGSELASVLQSIAFSSIVSDPSEALTVLRLSFLARKTSQLQNLGSYKKTSDLVETSAMELSAEEKSCSVAVINTTGKPHLARDTAQVLEENGVYIIREDSISEAENTTRLQVSAELKNECEMLFSKLVPFFPDTSTREVQTEETKRYRADIVIFLGKDITTSSVE